MSRTESDIFFTSDNHFYHHNIIEYCQRPFKNVEEMNETMVQRWNERVMPQDIVYHLGDFIFKVNQKLFREFMSRLNGHIFFVKGNHDLKQLGATEYAVIYRHGLRVKLMHNPTHMSDQYDLNFCGHVHNLFKFTTRNGIDIVNVGVDVWDFRPVAMREILKAYKRWKSVSNSESSVQP